jgi:hypothetical protein
MVLRERSIASVAIALLVSVCVVQKTNNNKHVVDAFSLGNSIGIRISSDSSLFSSQTSTDSSESETNIAEAISSPLPERKIAILLCPAQFCVPNDYSELWETLPSHIEVSAGEDTTTTRRIAINKELSRVVPLSRRDWIKVAKQLPTKDFIDANLRVHKTLDWYFDAIEEGLCGIIDAGGDIDGICIVGHSIGGWVARAYLGGLAR